MKLNILNNGASIDQPAKLGDAGYDIYAKSGPRVIGSIYQGLYYTAISHIEYDTELKVEPEFSSEENNSFKLVVTELKLNFFANFTKETPFFDANVSNMKLLFPK